MAFAQNLRAMKVLNVEKLEEGLCIINNYLLESLTLEVYIIPSTVILRYEVLEKTDFELWWRMGLAKVQFAYLNKAYVNRYKFPDSLSSGSRKSLENMLMALDSCAQHATSQGRIDLLSRLRGLYRNAWQNLIPVFASSKDIKGVLNAFLNSMRYGFRPGSVRLLFEAFLSLVITNR